MKWFERFEFVEEFFWFDRSNEISLLVLRLSCVVYSVFTTWNRDFERELTQNTLLHSHTGMQVKQVFQF